MFVVTVSFQIEPEAMGEFLALMKKNAATSKTDEPGCHQFDVCVDRDQMQVFLYEVYDNQSAFAMHLASPHFKSFDVATSNMITSKVVHTFEEVHV